MQFLYERHTIKFTSFMDVALVFLAVDLARNRIALYFFRAVWRLGGLFAYMAGQASVGEYLEISPAAKIE